MLPSWSKFGFHIYIYYTATQTSMRSRQCCKQGKLQAELQVNRKELGNTRRTNRKFRQLEVSTSIYLQIPGTRTTKLNSGNVQRYFNTYYLHIYDLKSTCVLPIPAGPTSSVTTPNGMPPHRAASRPFKQVGRWPPRYSFWFRWSSNDRAYPHSPKQSSGRCVSHFPITSEAIWPNYQK